MKEPTFSQTTLALLERLDKVIAEQAKPGCTSTENELMMEHVRSVLTGPTDQSLEPMFTEDVLKMAAIELIRAA